VAHPVPQDTEYEFELAPGRVRVRIRFSTEGPRVISFMAQLEALDQETWKPVRRYDDHHGRPHLDFLDRMGREYNKTWLDVDRSIALNMAIRDFRTNGRRYVVEFLEGNLDERDF
jgi:hypothetical protein